MVIEHPRPICHTALLPAQTKSQYVADHLRAFLLRFRELHAHPEPIPAKVVTSAALMDACLEHFQALAPLQQ